MLTEIKTETEHYFVDENNLKQGEYKDYHDYQFKHLWEHSFRLNDKRHGEYKQYHYDGTLYVHTFHNHGLRNGTYKKYYENGVMWVHTTYCHGLIHGEYTTYEETGLIGHATFFFQDKNLKVDPDTLTEKDKVYIMMSGRLPPRD